MTWIDFFIRLVLAFIIGAAIGVERQWRQTQGVLKTNVLVSIGSAMFVMMSLMTPGYHDATRVAAQVVSGIGFLGGGVILREGGSVRGLNTAATLWCAAAVGTMIGSGLLLEAYVGALAVVGANLLLRPLVQLISGQSIANTKSETRYSCRVICQSEDEVELRALLVQPGKDHTLILDGLYSKNIETNDIDNQLQVEVKANFVSAGRNDVLLEKIISILKLKVKVSEVSWTLVSEDTE